METLQRTEGGAGAASRRRKGGEGGGSYRRPAIIPQTRAPDAPGDVNSDRDTCVTAALSHEEEEEEEEEEEPGGIRLAGELRPRREEASLSRGRCLRGEAASRAARSPAPKTVAAGTAHRRWHLLAAGRTPSHQRSTAAGINLQTVPELSAVPDAHLLPVGGG